MAHAGLSVVFGAGNTGFQAGQIHGPVSAQIHLPDAPETPPLASSNIPFRQDCDFVERGNLLQRIEERLSTPAARVALVGLGGVGKSQLAIEYSYRARRSNPQSWVLWVHAGSVVRFEQGIREIAERMKIRGRNSRDADIFQLVRSWLADVAHGPWKIILDNADDASVLVQRRTTGADGSMTLPLLNCIPVCDHGSMLFTTRSQSEALQLVEYNDMIEVQPMSKGEAIALVRRKLGDDADRSATEELVTLLECMPLALTQAAAYIRRRGRRSSVRVYIAELQASELAQLSLLDRDFDDHRRDGEATNPILKTWQISFDYIRAKRETAAELLSMMCFCDRQAIPDLLLRVKEDSERDSWDTFEDDVELLLGCSIVSLSVDGSTFDMHRLVQMATRRWVERRGGQEQQLERLVTKLDTVFPSDQPGDWPVCQTLFAHAKALLNLDPGSTAAVLGWLRVMRRAADYASARGGALLGIEAVEIGERSWTVAKSKLEKNHFTTLISMGKLAAYCDRLGDSRRAAEMGEECWRLKKAKLGADHPDALTSMSNLAGYCDQLGNSRRAAEVGEECWRLRKAKLGADHPDTLASMSNLAGYCARLGDSRRAARMGEECWRLTKAKLGADHPDTLASMSNLAGYCARLGDSRRAARMGEECWRLMKAKLGADHPDTLTSMSKLAGYFERQGDTRRATEMGEECWRLRKAKLRADHPHTLISMGKLTGYYDQLGDSRRAAEMGEECWRLMKAKLGADHPDALTSMSNLAGYCDRLGDSRRAARMGEECWRLKKAKLGADHPETLISMSNLAGYYDRLGDSRRAARMEEECWRMTKAQLGADHPHTLTSMSRLAGYYNRLGDSRRAAEMGEECWRLRKAKLGADHPHTLASMSKLAGYCGQLGDSRRAAEMEAECQRTKDESQKRRVSLPLSSDSDTHGNRKKDRMRAGQKRLSLLDKILRWGD
ncbi:hypothetical protein Q7P37_009722 [Cladosporium fusiforme]